jgi:nicotinamide-nucleotide amidase
VIAIPAEIITTGRELLTGKTVNTNASWIAGQLTSKGVPVSRITSVDDRVVEISAAVSEALARRPSIIIITGGLGPTYDDLTSEGLSSALRLPLVSNAEALDQVRSKYASIGLPLTPARLKMADLPEGARPISNPVGTAPGIVASSGRTTIFALPGVPDEMRTMFLQAVLPAAADGGALFGERSLLLEGIPESSLSPLIDEWRKANPGAYIKSHPRGRESVPTLEIHISAGGGNGDALVSLLDRAERSFEALIKGAGGKIKARDG